MKNKRIISVINVKDGRAIQSFNYEKYLPLGKVESSVKNFDRWNSDEILINCIDRSNKKKGPDFQLIKSISDLGIGTPLIYGGGIRNLEDAKKVIETGADRLLLENIFYDNLDEVREIKKIIGPQAIIMSLSLVYKNKTLYQYNYKKKKLDNINKNFLQAMEEKLISEILIIDKINDGSIVRKNNFILKKNIFYNSSLILFGGLNSIDKISSTLKNNNISAVAIGNSLNYSEHRIQFLKNNISSFRKATFV